MQLFVFKMMKCLVACVESVQLHRKKVMCARRLAEHPLRAGAAAAAVGARRAVVARFECCPQGEENTPKERKVCVKTLELFFST